MDVNPALIIDGKRLSHTSGEPVTIINPATEAPIGTVPSVTPDLMDEALASSQRAFEQWRMVPAFERARILRRAAELLRERMEPIARVITLENGKPLGESRAEVTFGAEVFDWYAEEARRIYGRTIPSRFADIRMGVISEPVGVVAAFASWNAPIVTSAKKIAGALAAGCTIIAKPSEETPSAPLLMAECLFDAGLPPGALNVIYGDPPAISAHLMASPIVRKVTFTGSTAVGKVLVRMSAERLQRVTMELGGNAPVIVMDDVDPVETARNAAVAKFRSAGQICSSPTRFLIQESTYRPFVDAFAEAARAIRVGNGLDPETTMGPLISERRLAAIESLVTDAVSRGATVVTGGTRRGNCGYFFMPTILADVPADSRFVTEEPFGPIASVAQFSDLEEAIAIANSVDYGLASFAFTRSQRATDRICSAMQAGHVAINSFLTSVAETPFGGCKDSGYGTEGGSEGIAAFLTTKFIARGAA